MEIAKLLSLNWQNQKLGKSKMFNLSEKNVLNNNLLDCGVLEIAVWLCGEKMGFGTRAKF